MESSYLSYNPSSKILILTLDSFFKEGGGTTEYNEKLSISSDLLESKTRLLEIRQKIWVLLNKDQVRWPHDKQELQINQKLVNAEDFGGKECGALFLPAMDRYSGDFYQSLGTQGKQNLLKSKHHFLIVSACYGLLKPTELIQNYACQFGIPQNSAFRRWVTDKNHLTKIFIEYLKIHNIQRIFDFTQCAVPAYQKAISWDLVRQEFPDIQIYHANTWLPNDRSLRVFGKFVANSMLQSSEEDLLKIELDREFNNFSFQKKLPDFEDCGESDANPLDIIFEQEESNVVEFKTSAFGNLKSEDVRMLKTNHADIFPKIVDCQNIAKTLCAFMNTDGGNLFIGVKERESPNEKNKITGINSEMAKVGAAGYPKIPDGYERLITDGIIKVFIPEYSPATKYISFTFIEYGENTICRINVKPSKRPIFMKYYKGRNEDSFIIRNGRESESLDMKKTTEWILIHFCPKQ